MVHVRVCDRICCLGIRRGCWKSQRRFGSIELGNRAHMAAKCTWLRLAGAIRYLHRRYRFVAHPLPKAAAIHDCRYIA